jgi:hypothetical protein
MREVRRVIKKKGRVLITVPYSTMGGVTWQRLYSDAMIEQLIEDFIIIDKTYLLNSGDLRQPWKKMKNNIPQINNADPEKATICVTLEK